MLIRRTSLLALAALAAFSPASALKVADGKAGVALPGLLAAPPAVFSIHAFGALTAQPAATVLFPVVALGAPSLLPSSADAIRPALATLAPDRLGRISGESAKGLSGLIFESAPARPETGLTAGAYATSAADLEPSAPRPDPASAPGVETVAATPARQTLDDRLHFAKLLAQNYYWYTFTHVVNMWPSYKKRWKEAQKNGAANVSQPRRFFAHMRVAGISGRYYVLGTASLDDDAVIAQYREAFVKWFDAPGVVGEAELAAFDRFTQRARTYNAERRAQSNMRKHIRDALLKASTMEPAKIEPFFDSLLLENTAREIEDFQRNGEQARVLELFKTVLAQTLDEEPEGAKGEVVAAIILGSFASGSAGPKSDFDVELLTYDGEDARIADFTKRLTDRWIATGRHEPNPVTVHEFPSTPSRGVIDQVHFGDYIVLSRKPELIEALQRKPGVKIPGMIRGGSLRGSVNRGIQHGLILLSTFLGDA
ncbi:MAG: hypothetical protein HYZ74_05635, partial [Elusimicrobia bacterium]|nr:hypothetical protein [Elusimicrobiota bacterium]